MYNFGYSKWLIVIHKIHNHFSNILFSKSVNARNSFFICWRRWGPKNPEDPSDKCLKIAWISQISRIFVCLLFEMLVWNYQRNHFGQKGWLWKSEVKIGFKHFTKTGSRGNRSFVDFCKVKVLVNASVLTMENPEYRLLAAGLGKSRQVGWRQQQATGSWARQV